MRARIIIGGREVVSLYVLVALLLYVGTSRVTPYPFVAQLCSTSTLLRTVRYLPPPARTTRITVSDVVIGSGGGTEPTMAMIQQRIQHTMQSSDIEASE
eukprot:scaffold86717_cov49-Prasinocladus_malaysianus.AAC.2